MLIGAKAEEKAYKATFSMFRQLPRIKKDGRFSFLLRFEWLPKRQKIFVILKIKIFGFQDGNWQAFGLFLVNYNTLNYFMVTILTIHIQGLNFI